MKTVESVVASTSAIAASALGLAFVCGPLLPQDHLALSVPNLSQDKERQRAVSTPSPNMTSTETCTLSSPSRSFVPSPSSFTFSAPSPIALLGGRRTVSCGSSILSDRVSLEDKNKSLKRRLEARETTLSLGTNVLSAEEPDTSPYSTQAASLERMSAFSSNDGSLASCSQPASAAISQFTTHGGGSVAFSNADSIQPTSPSFTPAPTPPNKLVKRSPSSVRSKRGGSRIPLPTLKRPATRHDRDASLQEYQPAPSTISFTPSHRAPLQLSGSLWRPYFNTTVSFPSTASTASRKNSTGIPNPVKRLHHDRKHRPLLVSAREALQPVSINLEVNGKQTPATSYPLRMPSSKLNRLYSGRRFFSSPLPQRPSTASSNTSASTSRWFHMPDPQGNGGGDGSAKNSILSFGRTEPPNSSPPMQSRSFSPTNAPTPRSLPKWKRPSRLKSSDSKLRWKAQPPAKIFDVPRDGSSNTALEQERPAKRRDMTGGSISSSLNQPALSYAERRISEAGLPNPSLEQSRTVGAMASNGARDMKRTSVECLAVRASSGRIRSPRRSRTTSESSTFAGSDSDTRFNDDDGFESPNEAFFDSIRTRATSTGSLAGRGNHLEAMFDNHLQPQPSHLAEKMTPQSLNLPHLNKFSKEPFERPRHSIIEEEDSVGTPVRSTHNGSVHASPETFRLGTSSTRHIGSSPPELTSSMRYQPSDMVADMSFGEDDEIWDFGREENPPDWSVSDNLPHEMVIHGPHPSLRPQHPYNETPLRPYGGDRMNEARGNIFDWSEQQEKVAAGQSPPRPRTVHGKKDAEARGSRPARRAPSGLHVRSQSVPVAPESDIKKSQVITNKFGTWGVGSKGVTEDWDEDFDFDEPVPVLPTESGRISQDVLAIQDQATLKSREPSGSMRVPEKIQKQQEIVMANIGLLRDWGLLIEELKALRLRAAPLPFSPAETDIWADVEAMIDLADQETHDATLQPRSSPPSSPNFDMSAFDEPTVPPFVRNSPRMVSRLHAGDIFDSPSSSPARRAAEQVEKRRRSRKGSEAAARSVIEMLQRQGNVAGAINETMPPPKKVPFDTATLRRIVPWVQELRDKAKKSLHDAENVYQESLPDEQGSDMAFATIKKLPLNTAESCPTYLEAQSNHDKARSPLSYGVRAASLEQWDNLVPGVVTDGRPDESDGRSSTLQSENSVRLQGLAISVEPQPITPRREQSSTTSSSSIYVRSGSPNRSPPDDLPRRMELMTIG